MLSAYDHGVTIDFKKTLDCYRARHGEFRILDVPPLRFLMVDGHGDPNTVPEYERALATLYPLAYALKFASKREFGRDYVVPPLEALWWADDWEVFTTARDKSAWHWTLLLMVPEWIEGALIEQAHRAVERKGNAPALELVRIETLEEGRCVQTLHIGPYDDEAEVLERMHTEFIPSAGLRMRGRHHEVYLSDPRRVAPEKLRTILRQPVEEV